MHQIDPRSLHRSPVHAELLRAGASIGSLGGSEVATDFGSVAGEVAICRQAAGIVDRTDLVKLGLRGSPEVLAQLGERIAGTRPSLGTFLRSGALRLCALGAYHLLVICRAGEESRHREVLTGHLRHLGQRASCLDVSGEYGAITVAGPRAERVVATAGGIEPPLGVGDSLTRLDLGGRAVHALRESPTHFLMVSSAADAPGIWAQLHEAGGALGVGHAGTRALERYLIGERLQNGQQPRRSLI